MKVLLVCDEFFSWGVHGGYGRFTRKLAGELAKRDVEVEVVCQKISPDQKPSGESEVIDGVEVTTLPRGKLAKFKNSRLYKTDADVIHSQCGMLDTYITFKKNPDTPKVVTVQDFRLPSDYAAIDPVESRGRLKRAWANLVINYFYPQALKEASVVACQAELLRHKLYQTYGFLHGLIVLPNFVDVPENLPVKDGDPSVLWLGRLDPIKNPELCFETARNFPDVDFNILGHSHDPEWEKELVERYRDVGNLTFHGFDDGAFKEMMLEESSILINTSHYECLPVSFLEALAHGMSLLSTQNPDFYTTAFGKLCQPSVEYITYQLKELLQDDLWRTLGREGYEWAKKRHNCQTEVGRHLEIYRKVTKTE